jgi:hypothetical protein
MYKKSSIYLLVLLIAIFINIYLPEFLNFRGLTDFFQDFTASSALIEGRSIYDTSLIETIKQREKISFLSTNFHPPFTAFLLLPLAFLDYETAGQIFFVILLFSAIYFITVFISLHPSFPKLHIVDKAVAIILLLYWYPVYGGIVYGNINHLLAFFIALSFLQYQKSRKILSGSMIGIAALIKVYPLLLLVSFFFKKEYKLIFAALITCLIITCLSLSLIPLESYYTFATYIVPENIRIYSSSPINFSLQSVFKGLFTKTEKIYYFTDSKILSELLIYLSHGAIIFYFFLRSFQKKDDLLYTYSLSLLTMCLICPSTWEFHLLLTIPSLIYLYIHNVSRVHIYCAIIGLTLTPQIFEVLLENIYTPLSTSFFSIIFFKTPAMSLVYLFILLVYYALRDSNDKSFSLHTSGVL